MLLNRDHEYFGVHACGRDGERFVYAFRASFPFASFVELAGDFNSWRGEGLSRLDDGTWELIYKSDIPIDGMRYKYRVFSENGVRLVHDPFEREGELGNDRASIVHTEKYEWHDARHMPYPAARPIFIYEVRLSCIEQHENYRELAKKLGEYARRMSFSHIMPIFDGGGAFSPDPRFGNFDDLCFFTDYIHKLGLGVIFKLREFSEACASFTLSELHADGLFFGDISDRLSLGEGELFSSLNEKIHSDFPNAVTVAEENTAYPLITAGGLGFDLKLNRGWERAAISYLTGRGESGELSFSLRYAFGERYLLPLPAISAPTERLRILLAYFFFHPGEKLRVRSALPEELEGYIKMLGELYLSCPALSGDFEWILEGESPMVFRRFSRDRELICVLNFSEAQRRKFTVNVGDECAAYRDLLDPEARYEGCFGRLSLEVAPCSAMLLEAEK